MFDPCFGRIALKLGVIICAGIEIGLEVISIFVGCRMLYAMLVGGGPPDIRALEVYTALAAYLLVLLLLLVLVILDIVLIVATVKRNICLCKVWLIGTLVCSVLEFLISNGLAILGQQYSTYNLAAGVTHTLFFSYVLLVVLSFMEELKNEQTSLPAFEAVGPTPGDDAGYGQPSQSQSVGQQEPPPPSYDHPSKASVV